MIKHYCDICGKEMQEFSVRKDTDPLDYNYGQCEISFGIGLQGIYDMGFDEICHECQKRIENIDMDDFHRALKQLMGFTTTEEDGE